MWFSPKELKEEQKNGKLLWGAVNWKLRDPQELITDLEEEIKHKIKNIKDVKERVSNES